MINESYKESKRNKTPVFVVHILQSEFAFLKIENYRFNIAWGRIAKFEG